MSSENAIRRIAIVGTGVIGASWAALFLAHGLDVVATDPGPNAEANLREYTVLTTSTMPSYKDKMSEQETADLIAYLLTLKGLR